ncbi:DHA2 family efflux MFS transporter permease subunit [Effusibacillus pohliae]|uniref:DHA2 family efflux MFS transporter permease subunit n=1 Tax=Effusibacillus pohliae TaxID=232270 RepID=UPI0003797E21|nr:DHA2 family efflux MFS transporter permease subunit [Effusibacillus pohliae]
MSGYFIGYILFSLLVLAGVNRLLRRQPSARTEPVGQMAKPLEPEKPSAARKLYEPGKQQQAGEAKPDLQTAAQTGDSKATPGQPVLSPSAPATEPHLSKAAVEPQPDEAIKPGPIVAVLMAGAFVAILNQTLINVAIPHLMSDFNVSANTVQWLITGFMLVNGVLIPLTAFLIEKFGTRKLFMAAMIFFTVGAVLCAVAPTFGVLLAGRLIQAVGAGIIMPLMMTVFLMIFPPEKRGRAMGAMGIPLMFAPAIGPTLSGWIVQNYSWRVLFYIVIPIALIDLLLAAAWMKNVAKLSNPKLDVLGVVFSTLGFGGLLYGFSEAGNNGWSSREVVISLGIGLIGLALFVWRELTVEKPMLELRVFKYDVFLLTTIISSILNMALFAAMILLPIYLQNIRGFTPLESGLLLLPGALIMGIMTPIAGAIFDRIGARWLAVAGLLITTITTWEFSKLTADTSYSHILLLYIMRMFGMSFLMMTIMTAGLNQLPRRLSAHGTAMSNTLRQVAASLGTAFLVTVMSTRANVHLADYSNVVTADNPILYQKISGFGAQLAAATGLPQQAGAGLAAQVLHGLAMKQSVIDGINDAFLVATGITAVALVLAFFIKRTKPAGQENR